MGNYLIHNHSQVMHFILSDSRNLIIQFTANVSITRWLELSSQNVLKSDLKKSQMFPFGADLSILSNLRTDVCIEVKFEIVGLV